MIHVYQQRPKGFQDSRSKRKQRENSSHNRIDKRTSDLIFDKTDFESLYGQLYTLFMFNRSDFFCQTLFPAHMVKAHFTNE